MQPQLKPPRPASLAVWMTLGVAVFVLAGSLALLLSFHHQADREERRAFEALAEANASFLEHTPLPQSRQMAAQLGEVMGARVFFLHKPSATLVGKPDAPIDPALTTLPADGLVHLLPNGDWMIARKYRGDSLVFFVRPPADHIIALNRADTWITLATFWLLSLALGAWLARRITRPLKALSDALPLVGTDAQLPDIPTGRSDEIGLLAQTLARTHDSLIEERDRRRTAERHALLGRMATSLAHEVRNPVAAIRLHAQLLEDMPHADSMPSLRLIDGEAARIESLVNQWMCHAKPAPPVMTQLDPAAILREAIRVQEPQAAHCHVSLVLDIIPEPPPISGDRHRLLQVFSNLLLNSIQAMPGGGTTTIRLSSSGGLVIIIIADQGKGFSTTALARLGEPFYSEKEGGMGLGLAVAKEICESHGGALRVENITPSGARVTVELPAPPAQ